ncbi:MAG TPA: DedA family protein [Pirellulaceae bacterium]|nr:DedA family protein [Pirellulaceae bacterium]
MGDIIDFILHIDDHLKQITRDYGALTYAVLFAIVFCETGLVFMPLLPGDSLLFAAGTLAADPLYGMNIWLLCGLLIVAAIIGDTVNYHVGYFFGDRIPFINKKHIARTQAFFERHGKKTIILARFVPIVRTFAPFVAGIGKMNYGQFLLYNAIGGVAWVVICLFAGYIFGGYEIVQKNFELVVLAIIGVSVLPMAIELARGWFLRKEHDKGSIE